MLYSDAITDAMTKGLGQQRICVCYNIITSSMDVIFLFVLLPHYGMKGYFLSFLITHALNFALSLRRLIKISGVALSLKSVIIGSAATMMAVVAASLLPGPLLRSFCYICVLLCLLILGKVVQGEDLRWMTGIVQKK